VRRAALVTLELRKAAAAPAELRARLKGSELRNPYDNSPFTWDPHERAVVFKGLETNDRAVHLIYY
jgi:hypothetical protein